MATVTPEQMKKALSSLSALEGMASGYCELQDGFDTSKGIAENVRQVLAALASPAPQPADGDGSVMVRIDRVYVDAMRGDGLTGPFACVRLVEHEGEPRLELTTAPVPTPDTADWWREVAQGLGVEIAKMKALVSAPACVATTPQGDVCGLCGRPSADHRGPENAAAPAPAKAATDDAAYRAMRARVIAEQDARARELEGR